MKIERIFNTMALFTSAGTLLCCALPAIISLIAGGSALASLVSNFPFLITLSKNKDIIFITAGAFILTSLYFTYFYKKDYCLINKDCAEARKLSKKILWTSIGIYSVGAFFSYLAVPLMRLLGV